MEGICRPSKCGSNATLRLERQRGGPRIRIAESRNPTVDRVSVLKEMSLVGSGHELVRDSNLEVTLRLLVASQELETFGKWAIGR